MKNSQNGLGAAGKISARTGERDLKIGKNGQKRAKVGKVGKDGPERFNGYFSFRGCGKICVATVVRPSLRA